MRSSVLKVSLVALSMFLVLTTSQAFSQKLDVVPIKRVISFELKDKALKSVVEEIYKQTGYVVVFDEKWSELPLSGQYTGVTVEEFFQRAFHKQNVSLSYDDTRKVVNLRFFGESNIGKKNADTLAGGNESGAKVSEDIKVLHEAQRQELSTYLKDPESVDLVSGMKLVDIQELHSTQQTELEHLQNDPETTDPATGMTNVEINKLHDVQRAELEQLEKKTRK